VGDTVQVDEVVVTLETDKVAVDISSKASGTIVELCGKEDDTVRVGAQVFKVAKGAVAPPPQSRRKQRRILPYPLKLLNHLQLLNHLNP